MNGMMQLALYLQMKTGKATKAKPAIAVEPAIMSWIKNLAHSKPDHIPDQANMNHSKRDPSLRQRWKASS